MPHVGLSPLELCAVLAGVGSARSLLCPPDLPGSCRSHRTVGKGEWTEAKEPQLVGSLLGARATLSASHCHPMAYFLNSEWDSVPWMGGPTLREAKSPAQGHSQMGRVGV